MAAAGWFTDRPLTDELRSRAARFDFYQLVRLLLREHARDGQRVALEGRVRFRTDLSLKFPAHEITGVADDPKKGVTVTTPNYGVAGYLGPLPETFTEWMQKARARPHGAAAADFLDLFGHRINTLRYRIKARAHPVLGLEPPDESPQAERLAAIIGLASPELVRVLPFPRRALLSVAGLLANRRRTVVAIERVLARYLGADVAVSQFHGAWRAISPDDRTRLGTRHSRLGADTVLGRRAWDQAARIEVHIGPVPYAKFRELLPGGARHQALTVLLRFLTDRQVDSRVRLALEGEPPPPQLSGNHGGGPQLAQTAWLPPTSQGDGERAWIATFVVPAYDAPEENGRAGQ